MAIIGAKDVAAMFPDFESVIHALGSFVTDGVL